MLRFLKAKESSKFALYGLKSAIENLVWLHGCLDGYSCLFFGEWLRHSWYGFCDMVVLVD
jgi:hypothetical protein